MKIELVPDPGTDDSVSQAVVIALVREDLVDDRRPAAYDGAWRRVGLLDAVERGVTAVKPAPTASAAWPVG